MPCGSDGVLQAEQWWRRPRRSGGGRTASRIWSTVDGDQIGGGVAGELQAAGSGAAWPVSSGRLLPSPLSSWRQIKKAEAVARDKLGVARAAEGKPAVLGGGMRPWLPPPFSHAVAARRGRRRRAPHLAIDRHELHSAEKQSFPRLAREGNAWLKLGGRLSPRARALAPRKTESNVAPYSTGPAVCTVKGLTTNCYQGRLVITCACPCWHACVALHSPESGKILQKLFSPMVNF
uniref:Uncharacterized protein n=1 Tax=Oryza meridionalis TaxID=40149 RepID=A0A0E0BZ99_9ORYZ